MMDMGFALVDKVTSTKFVKMGVKRERTDVFEYSGEGGKTHQSPLPRPSPLPLRVSRLEP